MCVPKHADANHLLGGLACQAGNPALAIGLISTAIAGAPDRPIYHFNLGTVYQSLGRLAEAVESRRNALALKPDYAEAYFGLGNSLQGLGRMQDAAVSYRQALAVKPDNAATHNNLGTVLQGMGRMDDAVACFRRAIALVPEMITALQRVYWWELNRGSETERMVHALLIRIGAVPSAQQIAEWDGRGEDDD